MKKAIFICIALLFVMAGVTFAQTGENSITDALTNLGLSPAIAAVISLVFTTVILQLIPAKWAGVTKWIKEIAKLIYVIFDKIDERLNRISAKEKATRKAKKALAEKLREEQPKIMEKHGLTAKILTVVMLLALAIPLSAQTPWKGFFKPVTPEALEFQVKQRTAAAEIIGASTDVWLFRPSAVLTAVAFDFSEKPVLSKSMQSVGFGLSYGKFSDVENKAYCTFSANALLLTSVRLADQQSTAIGGALTVDVFNKLLGFGVGYLDKSFMLLTTISYSF